MQFPEYVRIGAQTYEIQLTDEPILIDHQECSGGIFYMDSVIKIRADLPYDRMWMTLWHEIFHGFTEDRGLDIGEADEENVVEAFARSMHLFVQDNPDIFEERCCREVEFRMESGCPISDKED